MSSVFLIVSDMISARSANNFSDRKNHNAASAAYNSQLYKYICMQKETLDYSIDTISSFQRLALMGELSP